jgi:uncharacterized protein (DUF934 family)
MRHILRQRELCPDHWRYLGEPIAAGDAVIVPFAELRREPERWQAWDGRLGVRLGPPDRVEELAADLARLDLVAVEFPSPGEVRAFGEGVRQDLVLLLARCGFDTLELAAGEDVAAAQRAFSRYSVAYQPGAAQLSVRHQRFFAA